MCEQIGIVIQQKSNSIRIEHVDRFGLLKTTDFDIEDCEFDFDNFLNECVVFSENDSKLTKLEKISITQNRTDFYPQFITFFWEIQSDGWMVVARHNSKIRSLVSESQAKRLKGLPRGTILLLSLLENCIIYKFDIIILPRT